MVRGRLGDRLTRIIFSLARRRPPLARVTIGALPDDVLLDIFQFCVPQFDPFLDYPPKTWYDLVHVCQRWRFVVFASPFHLDLHLLCTSDTPVREALDVWPPLPIKIWSGAGLGYLSDNVIAALEHPNRVREIWLFQIHSSLGRLITVMEEPFPALEKLCLEIDDEIGQTVPALANTFLGGSAPRLQSLTLNRIPFPTLPRLLLSSGDLSRLHLCNIPHSGYISPEALVRAVSTLTGLTYLNIGFESPASCPDPRTRLPPPLTPAILPALTTFAFHGVSEYLEDLVAQIDAPLLENVDITLFNQLIFDIRHLPRFIGHTSSFTSCNRAEIMFYGGHIVISLLLSMLPDPFRLKLRCGGVDWQVSSMAQICGQCSFFLSGIERLDIRGDIDLLESTLQVDMDNTQWLELFHPFAAVRTLSISREFRSFIESALKGLSMESVSEVLPALGDLHLERCWIFSSVLEQRDIMPFIIARELSGHPVSVHLWRKDVPKSWHKDSDVSENLSKIKAYAQAGTIKKAVITADQLQRRYSFLSNAMKADPRAGNPILTVAKWHAGLDPIDQAALETAEPLTWLEHLHSKRPGRVRRFPWHVTALLFEERVRQARLAIIRGEVQVESSDEEAMSPEAAAKHEAFLKARGRHYSNEAEAMKRAAQLSDDEDDDSPAEEAAAPPVRKVNGASSAAHETADGMKCT